jgi:hypothetical protein
MNIIRRNIIFAAAIAISPVVIIPASAAQSCTTRGGEGNGIFQGFASYTADAALKNSAMAWGGANVKIGKISHKCKLAGVIYTCTARAKVCK